MYNVSIVQDGLKNVIGFKQVREPDIDKFMDFLLDSESGEYFNDFHPLVKPVNIDSSAPDFDAYDTQTYAAGTDYLKGEIVTDGTDLYRSKVGTSSSPNVGNALNDTNFWEPFNYLSGYIEDIVLGAIPKTINNILAKKKARENTKELFSDLKLYQGGGTMTSKITKSGRFCGFEVEFKNMKDLIMSVPMVGIQSDTAQADLPFYIYHNSQVDPIYTFNLEITKELSFEWHNLLDNNAKAPVLQFVNENYQAGGTFMIGYYEDDLVGQMVKNIIDLSVMPCGGCSPYNQRAYKSWNQHLNIHPFSVSSSYINYQSKQIWDTTKNSYTYDTNWGLNLAVTLNCDYTDFIVRNKLVFKDALGMQVAHDLIYEQAYSTENNAIAEKNRKLALYELDDRENNTAGLMTRLKKMYMALDVDLSNLNSKCLPKKSRKGLMHSAI